MSLSRGELLVEMYERQAPIDAQRPWVARVVAWRVSASTYHALSLVAAAFDPSAKSVTPLISWSLVRDPTLPDGHAIPLDASGLEVTPWSSPT